MSFYKRTIRALSLTIATVMSFSTISVFPAQAEIVNDNNCVLFAQGNGCSISISSSNITINGDLVTNGSTGIDGSPNFNGNIYQNQSNTMLNYHSAINELYYWEDVNFIEDSYVSSLYNESITIPTFVQGEFCSDYNVAISDSSLMTMDDIEIKGETLNSTNSVIYSQLGDIVIDCSIFSSSGLIYAPLGDVHINADSVNFRGMIVAQNIDISAEYNCNLNSDTNFISQFGDGVTVELQDDADETDIGDAYFEELTSEEDVIEIGNGDYCVRNQFLLSVDDSKSFEEISALVQEYDASIVGYIQLTNDFQIKTNHDVDVDTLKSIIDEFNTFDFVELASFNYWDFEESCFHTNDSEWTSDWNEDEPKGRDWNIEAIKFKSALVDAGVVDDEDDPNISTDHLYNVKIGLIDDCFDNSHEDLNFVKTWNDSGTSVTVNSNHGNHVAGIMAANFSNNEGITGVCVKNRLYGYPIEVGKKDFQIPGEEVFETKAALALLIGNNVKIINYSRGYKGDAVLVAEGGTKAQEIIEALNNRVNIMDLFLLKLINSGYDFNIIVAAGNDNDDTPLDADARYSHYFQFSKNFQIRSRIICVGSVMNPQFNSKTYGVSDFSNTGDRVDIVAPGERIYSCSVKGHGNSFEHYHYIWDGVKDTDPSDVLNYFYDEGTSMAAPHVSGTLGLAYSTSPTLSAQQLKSIVISKENSTVVPFKYKTTDETGEYFLLDTDFTVKKSMELHDKLTSSGNNNTHINNKGIIIGSVSDATSGELLSDVEVTAIKETNGTSSDVAYTGENGVFELVLSQGQYHLNVFKKGYLPLTYNIDSEIVPDGDDIEKDEDDDWDFDSNGNTIYLGEIKLIPENDTSIYDNKFKVTNVLNSESVEGAQISFREGWNKKTGDKVKNSSNITVTGISDKNGNVTIPLKCGYYTAEITKNGFITSYANVISYPDSELQYLPISPKLADNEYRFVLTWGETPRDLDSHLVGSSYKMGEHNPDVPFHIYYGNKMFTIDGQIVAQLDLDDTTSYGPETVTLSWTDNGGYCSYYVYDFTNGGKNDSYELSYSSAKVVVYKGNKILKTYYVPTGKQGTRWLVCNVSEGKIETVNEVV